METWVKIRVDVLCVHFLSCVTREHRLSGFGHHPVSISQLVGQKPEHSSHGLRAQGPTRLTRRGPCVLWPARAGG